MRIFKKREPEKSVPAEMCDICGDVARSGFKRCAEHIGVVFGDAKGNKETRA